MNDFFATIDPIRTVGFAAGLFLLWVLTGIMKSHGFGREGDVRKINHIAAFTGGALLFGWLPESEARPSFYLVSLEILLLVAGVCCFRHCAPFRQAFAANTRASDAPHEATLFWSSWLISLLALAVIDVVFARMDVVRTVALIVGVADGLAEPIGRRFGRHRYRVPALSGEPTIRSIEGSVAVLLSALAVMLACTAPGSLGDGAWLLAAMGTAFAATAIEAISPRGTDNATIALASAWLVWGFMEAGWIR